MNLNNRFPAFCSKLFGDSEKKKKNKNNRPLTEKCAFWQKNTHFFNIFDAKDIILFFDFFFSFL